MRVRCTVSTTNICYWVQRPDDKKEAEEEAEELGPFWVDEHNWVPYIPARNAERQTRACAQHGIIEHASALGAALTCIGRRRRSASARRAGRSVGL